VDIIKFLVIILLLVSVHEFGHYIAAKIFGVYVSEFALGFGPKIFSHKGKETEFTVRALPLGGFAALAGEDGVDEDSPDHLDIPYERTMKGVNRFKQFIILFGGAFMNLLLAFILFCFIAASQSTISTEPIIGNVSENTPAYVGGLQAGDRILSFSQNNVTTNIHTYSDVTMFTSMNTIGPYDVTVQRGDQQVTLHITPEYNEEESRYIAGFSPTILPPSHNPVVVVRNGFNMSVDSARMIFASLRMLVSGQAGVGDLSGPVGMVQMTGQVSQQGGFLGLVNFAALLSINLAIFNLLPIPALDGGRILIVLIEAITRKKLKPEWEARIISISFMLLIALIIVVTFNDISRIFSR